MDEYNERGRGSPDPSLARFTGRGILPVSYDSGDADDFHIDLLDDCDYPTAAITSLLWTN